MYCFVVYYHCLPPELSCIIKFERDRKEEKTCICRVWHSFIIFDGIKISDDDFSVWKSGFFCFKFCASIRRLCFSYQLVRCTLMDYT